jgi:predicted PurR-regulated permease PerM
MIIVPSYIFLDSVVDGIKDMGTALSEGTATVPPPKENVKDWPMIGEKIYDSWLLASQNLEGAIERYSEQVSSLGHKMLSSIVGLTGGILQFIISSIIAGVLLASYESSASFTKVFFKKIIGDRGEEYAKISADTIRNVGKGILGVALIQSFLFGLGLVFAGVPYAGLWALLVLVMAIIQLPPTLVAIPIVVYLFNGDSMLSATLWSIYLLIIGGSDNFLKPILLGRGASVPMLIVFLGAIGGFVVAGFVGLFIGAIILTLGYKLFVLWLYGPEAEAASSSSDVAHSGGDQE